MSRLQGIPRFPIGRHVRIIRGSFQDTIGIVKDIRFGHRHWIHWIDAQDGRPPIVTLGKDLDSIFQAGMQVRIKADAFDEKTCECEFEIFAAQRGKIGTLVHRLNSAETGNNEVWVWIGMDENNQPVSLKVLPDEIEIVRAR